MARTDEKVGYTPRSNPDHTPLTAARGVEAAFKMLEGRWKMVILFHLFDREVLRFSELERAIPAISQKMLIQQLRQLEADGIIVRTLHPEVPPRVEYQLSAWGRTLCPALDSILAWAENKPPARE
jgi:DNA-binding HxlR family transcriptional regulator